MVTPATATTNVDNPDGGGPKPSTVRGMTFQVGDYEATEPLGAGGSAEVWLGVRRATGDAVALKVFPADALPAVQREAALAAVVDHPHVVKVLDVVADADRAVLVTEYAAGGDLADLLQRRGRLSSGETLTVLLPLAAALATAHERQVVHGDITPGNILFDHAGRPLLSDLGAARAAADSGGPVSTTAPDAAPELARGAEPTPATDMFSLGSVALACLTGRSAWPADDLRDVLIQAAAGQWPDPGDDCGPAPLIASVRALLQHDPERRPGAASLVLDLRASGRPEPLDLATRIRPALGATSGEPPLRASDAGSTFGGRHGLGGSAPAVGKDAADGGRPARSRATTKLRPGTVRPTAETPPARRVLGRRRPAAARTGAAETAPARSSAGGQALRWVVVVVSCTLVAVLAAVAGIWWAGNDRTEPVALGAVTSRNPSAVTAGSGRVGVTGRGTPGSTAAPTPIEPTTAAGVTQRPPATTATALLPPTAVTGARATRASTTRSTTSRGSASGRPTTSRPTTRQSTPSRSTTSPGAVPRSATPPATEPPSSTPLVTAPPPTTTPPANAPPAARPAPTSPATRVTGSSAPTGVAAADWVTTIRALDDARSRALVARDPALLDAVYTTSSASRTADALTIRALLSDGLRVSGAEHVVQQVRPLGGRPMRLVVSDSMPAYDVVDSTGAVVGRTPARAVSSRIVELTATASGFRISKVDSP